MIVPAPRGFLQGKWPVQRKPAEKYSGGEREPKLTRGAALRVLRAEEADAAGERHRFVELPIAVGPVLSSFGSSFVTAAGAAAAGAGAAAAAGAAAGVAAASPVAPACVEALPPKLDASALRQGDGRQEGQEGNKDRRSNRSHRISKSCFTAAPVVTPVVLVPRPLLYRSLARIRHAARAMTARPRSSRRGLHQEPLAWPPAGAS